MRVEDYHFVGDLEPGGGTLLSGPFFRPAMLRERFARCSGEAGVVGSRQGPLPETETSGILARPRGATADMMVRDGG